MKKTVVIEISAHRQELEICLGFIALYFFSLQTRQVIARCEDLKQLENNFRRFTEYRSLERVNIKAFHQTHVCGDTEIQKQVAQQVLTKLQSRIQEEDAADLCQLLACVVAPRCCLKIDIPKPPRSKK